MIKKIFILGVILLLPFLINAQDWNLSLDKNGIKIYTRKPQGKNFKEFKGTTVIKAPINDIFNFIRNAGNATQWVDGVCYSKIIKSSGNTYYSYQQISIPIPFKNRDLVLKNTVINNKNNDEITIKIISEPNFYAENDNFVRIKETYGYWKLKKITQNTTKVTYQIYSDPAGDLPDWLVNKFITSKPYQTLYNLKKHFEK